MSSLTKNLSSDSKKMKDKNNKDETNDSEDESKSKMEKNVKKKAKKVQDVDESQDENDDEEDDEDEVEIKPGLLDLPLEVTGSRERKKVERLALSFHQPTKEKKIEISEGKGSKLMDCPRIEQQLVKVKAEALKPLHKLLFNRPGAPNEIKKNIRRFNGFVFDNETAEMEKKRASLEKLTAPILKKLSDVLDLERGGTKDELVSRILAFLVKPEPSGRSVAAKSVKKPSKRSKKGKNSKSESSEDDHEEKDDDNDEDKNENSPDDGEKNDEEDKNEDENEKKDESADEKSSEKNEDLKKATKKVENKAKGKSKREKLHSSESESSDDEPLAKKGKMPPTDEELKNFIKRILDGANLEEITMKTVCKQVYAKFPEFDLSNRKEFIKSTVRSIIS